MGDGASRAFAAMADPTRRAILRALGEHEALSVNDIASRFQEISRSAVSAHLRVLRSVDMVEERRRGQFRYYSLGPNRAEDVVDFLRNVYAADLDLLADDE